MTVNFLGIPIHEFDVAVTDLILAIETGYFAYVFWMQKKKGDMPNTLGFALFALLSLSSMCGVLFHAFFPTKTATTGGYLIWMCTALSIGLTACVIWLIQAYVLGRMKLFKKALPFVIGYFCIFAVVMLFINYQYKTIILFYAPPLVTVAIIAVYRYITTHKKAWLGVLGSMILSFISAYIQIAKINIDPVYFNFNSLYHVGQAISLWILFSSSRSLIKGLTSTISHKDP